MNIFQRNTHWFWEKAEKKNLRQRLVEKTRGLVIDYQPRPYEISVKGIEVQSAR